jgi:aspartate/methionine/tyrosine aminotransferase
MSFDLSRRTGVVRHDEMPSIAVERALAGKDMLPLKGTIAAPLPQHVREAIEAALDEHVVTPPSRGHAALLEAIAQSLPAPADPEREILVTNGAMHALSLSFRALLRPGDEAIVPTPCYFFAGLIERAGGIFVPVPSRDEDGWRWDPDAIERAVTPKSRILVLTNPNNPTGYLPSRAEIDELLAVASRHDLAVITDEAYDRCIHEGMLASAWGAPNVILIRSLGKSLAMPAWRIGFVAGERSVVDACLRELEWDVIRVSHVAQRAATAALDGPQEWLTNLVERYRRDRDAAHAVIADDAILSARLPVATPFLFLRLGRLSSENLLAAGVAVVDGAAFGAPGNARLPFAGAADLADELHGRLALATS